MKKIQEKGTYAMEGWNQYSTQGLGAVPWESV